MISLALLFVIPALIRTGRRTRPVLTGALARNSNKYQLTSMSTLKRKADLIAAANDPKKPKKDSSLTSFFGAPKIVSSTTNGASSSPSDAQGAASKFDKEKWVATLNAEQKDLLKLEIDTLDPTWLAHLKDEIVTPGFLNLKRFLKREVEAGKTIFPPLDEVYSW